MTILRETVSMHVKDVRTRSISIRVPDDIVILARLEDRIIGKNIAVETVEGGPISPGRG